MVENPEYHPAAAGSLDQNIRILPATEDSDLEQIAELAATIWWAHYPGIITPAQIRHMLARMYSLDTLRAEIHEHHIHFYQLFAAGQISGFASLGPAGTPDVFKLHKLYVVPAAHGHGLGWRLLKHCEQESARRGAKRLLLAVNKRNEKAVAFYQRNGFSTVEAVVNDIGGGFVMDDFIMAKELQ